jgi:ANTAR domain
VNDLESIDGLFRTALAGEGSNRRGRGRLCSACVKVLPVDGASVSVMPQSAHQEMLCASDDTAERLQELQTTLGEGPGLDAFDTGGPVIVADFAADDGARWPMFAAAVAKSPVGSIFSFPLQIGVIRVGSMELYRRNPAHLGRRDLAAALRVSEIVTSVLLASAEGDMDDHPFDQWLEQSRSSREINQATGMVLAQLEVTAEVAYVRMRAFAFSENRRISDVARDVVARRLRFSAMDP